MKHRDIIEFAKSIGLTVDREELLGTVVKLWLIASDGRKQMFRFSTKSPCPHAERNNRALLRSFANNRGRYK